MEMTGEFRIPAPRERVWASLNDPEILKASIPGCETIEKVSESEFAAKVTAKVGPVKATFGGKVVLSDLDPPQSYTISGEGQGGVAGFARGSAKVRLAEAGGETLLSYTVEAHVGGKLAQVGSRLVDATAKKMAGDFFSRFRDAVAPQAALVAAEEEKAPEAVAAPPPPPRPTPVPPPGFRLPPAVWIPGLVVVVGAILYYFASHAFK
jgi:uncharacterized protein